MRRIFRVAGWIGCGFSSLLLVGTVVLWARSMGHAESWQYASFEARPEWDAADLKGQGIERSWYAGAIRGRFWLASAACAPENEFKSRSEHWRGPISADEAMQLFGSYFQPGEQPFSGGSMRAWRWAGAGFGEYRSAVDHRIGLPRVEGFSLAVPFWMLTLLFGLWPALFLLRRVLRRKGYTAGCCPKCGYDLRATPDAAGPRLARCPECGREVAAAHG